MSDSRFQKMRKIEEFRDIYLYLLLIGFLKLEHFSFGLSCYTSLSRFPVNEMKNLLIGSRGDPKSILLKKGSPKREVPQFHTLEKV